MIARIIEFSARNRFLIVVLILGIIGGVVTSFVLELLIYPAVYTIWKWWAEVRPAARR